MVSEEREQRVLGKGFVKLIRADKEECIVDAARRSYGKGTKRLRDDKGLIRYLIRNFHTGPLEFCDFTFFLKIPIFVARQLMRHRTANINELSGRYSQMPSDCYIPDLANITTQDPENKQGGTTDILHEAEELQIQMLEEQETLHKNYQSKLRSGMRRELARINLPQSQFTELYFKIDLNNLLKLLHLRLDKHAQYEIRVVAEAMASFVEEQCPIVWEAFVDYRLGARSFSRQEMEILKKAIDPELLEISSLTKREQTEFLSKVDV